MFKTEFILFIIICCIVLAIMLYHIYKTNRYIKSIDKEQKDGYMELKKEFNKDYLQLQNAYNTAKNGNLKQGFSDIQTSINDFSKMEKIFDKLDRYFS